MVERSYIHIYRYFHLDQEEHEKIKDDQILKKKTRIKITDKTRQIIRFFFTSVTTITDNRYTDSTEKNQ